jgi:hypothetical protein
MWFDNLTTLRKLEGRIISFIDQAGVVKKILKEITFDPSYGSTVRVPHGPEEDRRVNSPSRGRSRDSLSQRLIGLRWKLI